VKIQKNRLRLLTSVVVVVQSGINEYLRAIKAIVLLSLSFFKDHLMKGKLLKGIGLALIAMPEPFTTPIGAGLVAASFVISKTEEVKKRKHLRHILGEYLNTYRPFGYGMDYKPKTSADLPYRQPRPLFGTNNIQVVAPMPIRFASRDSQKPVKETKAIFHVLDQRMVAKRYVETGGTRAGFVGYWGRQARIEINNTQYFDRNLRLSLPSLS
jgi:hypothetical protein